MLTVAHLVETARVIMPPVGALFVRQEQLGEVVELVAFQTDPAILFWLNDETASHVV